MTDETPAPATVTIPGTAITPPVNISADEHQLLADLKASGHDLGALLKDAISKI